MRGEIGTMMAVSLEHFMASPAEIPTGFYRYVDIVLLPSSSVMMAFTHRLVERHHR
jgi:hypothetical protein